MRNSIFSGLARLAMQRRRLIFIVTSALTIGLGIASARLQFDMRWSTLLPATLPVVQEYKKIDDNFYQPGNMIVAVSGPDAALLERITDEAAAILQKDLVCAQGRTLDECLPEERYARFVYGALPQEWLIEHSARLTKPNDARRLRDLYRDPRLLPWLTHLNDDFEAEYMDSENVKDQERQIVASLDAVQRFVETLDAAAGRDVGAEQMRRVVRDLTVGNPYMLSLDRAMSLLMVSSAVPGDDVAHITLLDKRIETLLAPLAAKYPNFKIERTGMTAVSRDEMDSVGPQTMVISLVALALVFLLLVWNFRSVSIPILGLIPIVIGIIWTTGLIALTLGQMNIVTSMIMVVLLGLGIDFSIHIASRYHEEIAERVSIERALQVTLHETARSVTTGAVTTAAAFYTLMVADTKGIAEFGLCAGTGVLITLIATLWILPAMLAFRTERQFAKGKNAETSRDFMALGRFAGAMGRWKFVVIFVVVLFTVAGFWAGQQLDWEWNFLNLEAEGLRSVELQDEIIEKFKLSVSVSLLTADSVEESRRLRKAFKSKGLIGDVDDISLWVSRPDVDESLKFVRELREATLRQGAFLPFVGERGADFDSADEFAALNVAQRRASLADELDRLWANIVEIQALSIISGQDRVVEKTRKLVASRADRADGLLKRIAQRFLQDETVDWAALTRFARMFDNSLHAQVARMARGDRPVTIDMVPPEIVAKYVSHTEVPGYLMQILPKKSLYERHELELFQTVVSKVDPNVTGMPQMILNMNLETLREGRLASFLAIFVIFGVLLFDFRRHLIVAPLAFLPLICGMALMLGGMWLFGEKLNYVNMIALPVIIGIGVDDGVHYFHRLIHEGRGGMRRAVTSVGRAMLMTSLTTMIGFGSLMLYMMRGMQSMGFALFVGVGMCFLVTITLLPALTVLCERYIMKKEKR